MFMIGYSTHPSYFLPPPSGADSTKLNRTPGIIEHCEIALEYSSKAGTLGG
jgi:hypothetical protein